MGKDREALDGAAKGESREGTGREKGTGGESLVSKMLFNDLCKFHNKKVLISVYGGEEVSGKLLGYDEVANCVLESGQHKKIIVLGKSITSICDASTIIL